MVLRAGSPSLALPRCPGPRPALHRRRLDLLSRAASRDAARLFMLVEVCVAESRLSLATSRDAALSYVDVLGLLDCLYRIHRLHRLHRLCHFHGSEGNKA